MCWFMFVLFVGVFLRDCVFFNFRFIVVSGIV